MADHSTHDIRNRVRPAEFECNTIFFASSREFPKKSPLEPETGSIA